MVFIPKDSQIKSVLDRLSKENGTYTSFDNAKKLSRYRQIRDMRALDQIFIGMDRKKKLSVIYVKKHIKKKGNGYIL
jgi:hypothetical protein